VHHDNRLPLAALWATDFVLVRCDMGGDRKRKRLRGVLGGKGSSSAKSSLGRKLQLSKWCCLLVGGVYFAARRRWGVVVSQNPRCSGTG